MTGLAFDRRVSEAAAVGEPCEYRPGRAWSLTRRPWIGFGMISVAALGLRVGYAFLYQRHTQPTGDAFYYHFQANLLVAGKGFVDPWALTSGRVVPGAAHPPLFTLVLAPASALGLKTSFAQMLWTCGLGALAVVVVGLAAREVGGDRVGLVAAGIAAVYPDFVINDGAVMSETLELLVTALVILCFYRLWRRPSMPRAAALGVSGALAALTRAELVLVLALLILAMAFWWRRGLGPARRWALGAVATAGALVTFAPWWAYTIPRFAEPVPLSTQSGVTLVSANCDSTYFGPRIGYWDFSCGQQLGVHLSAKDDASVQDVQLRRAALHYMAQHKSRVPVVMAARLGREFGVFEPLQQIDFEWQTLHRPRLPAYLGLGAFFAAGLLALSGARILRRRRISLIPFGTVLAVTVVVCLASFGQTRYRTSLDAAIVMLAAVSIVQLATLVSKRRQINTENPDPTMALPAGVPAGPPGHRSPNSALREREDG